MAKVIGIFSGKNFDMIESEGGSGSWVIKSERVKKGEYILLIRNHREQWAVKNDGISHGQAFMVGIISGCIPHEKYAGRKVITISKYSLLPNTENFKNAWKKLTNGQRYPISYLNTEELLKKLNFDINSVKWSIFNPNVENKISATNEVKDLPQVIADAKEMIAQAAGVDKDKINIQINL